LNITQKPWVRSAFSELNASQSSSIDEASVSVPAKRTRSASTKARASKTATATASKIVDLTAVDDVCDNSPACPVVSDNWMESFAPSVSDELAVHPKKLDELRDWFRHCGAVQKKFPAQICLLTGPAGSGKTAALRVQAKEFGYELQEWINPIDCEEISTLGDQPSGNCYATSQLDVFKSFLLRASRYKSLLAMQSKRLLLVEDIPNILLKDATSTFEELLIEYTKYGKSPLVFIVADSKSRMLNISYKLFTDQLKTNLRIEHISFNAIAVTIMQKSMKRFCSIMQQQPHKALYKVPSQNVVDSIVVCAQGDIRNALINLHFGSLIGAPSIATTKLNISTSATVRKRKATNTLKSIGRDESITMMHALGRVFNPKYEDNRLQHNPEELAEAFYSEPRNFVNFIHANYLPHFRDIAHVNDAVNDIGLADMLLQEYRDDTLALVALNTAIRGCMVANAAPVSGWMPVRGPKRFNVQSTTTTLTEQNLLGVSNISKGLYASEYSSFVKCIAKK
ncbi:Rad17, partial [Drosophila busckii]